MMPTPVESQASVPLPATTCLSAVSGAKYGYFQLNGTGFTPRNQLMSDNEEIPK